MALEKQGIVNLNSLGNTTLCSFNNKFNALVFEAEYERKSDLIKDKNFKIICNRLNELKSPFISLLFGSWAKKTQTKHSDIDMLFIVAEEKIEKELRQAISLIPLEIHPTFVNYKDFVSMANSKDFSVVTEAIKNNIILIGIEEYYRLMEHVK
jgi:predicted nucleotidyltransferase